jgi:hypothetical protein
MYHCMEVITHAIQYKHKHLVYLLKYIESFLTHTPNFLARQKDKTIGVSPSPPHIYYTIF